MFLYENNFITVSSDSLSRELKMESYLYFTGVTSNGCGKYPVASTFVEDDLKLILINLVRCSAWLTLK